MQDISLEWRRDALGYRIEEGVPAVLHPENPLMPEGWRSRYPLEPEKPLRIVRQGGTLIPYRPTANLGLIFCEFLNIGRTPEGVLDFVNRFGPLTGSGNNEGEGESVPQAIDTLDLMADLIQANADEKVDHQRRLLKALGPDGIRLGGVENHLVFDESAQALRIQKVAVDLKTALYLRLFEVLLSDTVLRRCKHCSALFAAGLGTGRHLNARFCSDEHRVLFNSLKRTPRAA